MESSLFVRRSRKLGFWAWLATVWLVAGFAIATVCQELNFGAASGYGLLALGNHSSLSIKSTIITQPTVWGVGPGGKIKIGSTKSASASDLTLVRLEHHPDVKMAKLDTSLLGTVTEVDMAQAASDAINVNLVAGSLAPTQIITGKIEDRITFTGNGGLNVIELRGEVNLDGDLDVMTIRGGPSDYFVFNMQKKFTMKNGAEILLLGIDSRQVIFNQQADKISVKLLGAFTAGTFLVPNGKLSVTVGSQKCNKKKASKKTSLSCGQYAAHDGALMGSKIKIRGIELITNNALPFECPLCPNPEFGGTSIGTPGVARSRGKRSAYFHASYDPDSLDGQFEAFHVEADGTIMDENGDPAVDSTTHQMLVSRDPYWDASEELPINLTRNVYTTKSASRVDFDATKVTSTDLAVTVGEIGFYPNHPGSGVTFQADYDPLFPETTSAATLAVLHKAMVSYLQGKDAFDENLNNISTEMRPDILGPVFHSNVLLVGSPSRLQLEEDGYDTFYSTYKQRDRVVYLGAGDGMIHGFDAGSYWDGIDVANYEAGTGKELFAYIPGALLDKVKYVPVMNKLLGVLVDGPTVARDVWLGDGSGTDITKTSNEWATLLLAGYRDGGQGYIALDVTQPGAGASDAHGPYPKLLWEFTDAKVGHSWSAPVITRVRLAGASSSGDHCGEADGEGDCREQWVAIFGGGYEVASDPNDYAYIADPQDLGWSPRSKALFMVRLDTGAVIASVEFDPTGTNGPTEMKYALPSKPAVVDTDTDGFADVVYIGDLGGQLWKWDISAIGTDTDADSLIDNWNYGVFFKTAPERLNMGQFHYRSLYDRPAVAYSNGTLTLAFASGERNNLIYQGDANFDENNRVWVLRDPNPTGTDAFATLYTESDLTDVTALSLYANPGNSGYYFTGADGEKFMGDVTIFGGYVLAASYVPETAPVCGPGESFLYTFQLSDGEGYLDEPSEPPSEERRMLVGRGVPSVPRVSIASDPGNDKVYMKTSEGEVIVVDAPPRDDSLSMIYWRQKI